MRGGKGEEREGGRKGGGRGRVEKKHPVVPIYGDISKNRHITAYGKGANIAFLVYARKTAKSYMMKTFSWDFKGEIMQQLIQFGRVLKKIMMQGMSSNFSIQKN